MGKMTNTEKVNEGNYHPPETIGLVYCVAVLEIVLKEHSKAKELYSRKFS